MLVLDIYSNGWKLDGAKLLLSENRTRCLLGLDIQPELGKVTTQLKPPKVSVNTISEEQENDSAELTFWENNFLKKFNDVFQRLGRSKNHKVFTLFKSPLIPIQEKGRRVPIHIQTKMGAEIKKLIREGNIVKLHKCTSDQFVAPVVITAKKDGTVKLAMDAKAMNSQIYKNKFQMPNLLELLDSAAQIITVKTEGTVWFTSQDLKNAFCQLPLDESVIKDCNFSIVCGEFTGTYRFKSGLYGQTDMPNEFQKAMDNTIQGIQGVFCFLDDILIISKGSVTKHNEIVDNVLSRLDKERFALKLSKCYFSKTN